MFGFRKRAPGPQHQVSVAGLNRSDLRIAAGETLVAALLRQDVKIDHLCLVGDCGSCRCRLTRGRIKLKRDISAHVSPADLAEGAILACQSFALGDIDIAVPGITPTEAAARPGAAVAASIAACRQLAHNVIELRVRPEAKIAYRAGQYAALTLAGPHGPAGITRRYSFADAPGEDDAVATFHIRHVPGGQFTDWLFAADRTGTALTLAGPYGSFGYLPGPRSLVAIAGGTGLAPIRAILRSLRHAETAPEVTVMVAARTQADLYGLEELAALARAWPAAFTLLPVLSDEPWQSAWPGARGFCTDHFERLGQLDRHDFYVCGPPPMIDAVTRRLADAVPASQLHVDRFLDARTLNATPDREPR